MRLYYYEGEDGVRNFGDELNPFLWSRLLPDLDQRGSPDWLFVGIGTLLNDSLPTAARTIVFGSGVGYGTAVPRPDETWRVHFVRGPRSAAALGLPSSAGLTDPAILVSGVWRERAATRTRHAFMPHWDSANEWIEGVCRDADIGYIDPRWPVERVLRAISETEVLLAEAMHGAIVADALRIPWIPVCSTPGVLPFKWLDWCNSVGLNYVPQTMVPIWAPSGDRALARARAYTKRTIVSRQLKGIIHRARPCLSADQTWKDLRAGVEGKLDEFRAETEFPAPPPW